MSEDDHIIGFVQSVKEFALVLWCSNCCSFGVMLKIGGERVLCWVGDLMYSPPGVYLFGGG